MRSALLRPRTSARRPGSPARGATSSSRAILPTVGVRAGQLERERLLLAEDGDVERAAHRRRSSASRAVISIEVVAACLSVLTASCSRSCAVESATVMSVRPPIHDTRVPSGATSEMSRSACCSHLPLMTRSPATRGATGATVAAFSASVRALSSTSDAHDEVGIARRDRACAGSERRRRRAWRLP